MAAELPSETPPPAVSSSRRASGRTLVKRASLVSRKSDSDLESVAARFLNHKSATGTRDRTLKSYGYDLVPFVIHCRLHGIVNIAAVKTIHVEQYLSAQKDAGFATSTRRNRGVVLQALLKYAHREGYIASERLYDWKVVKAERADVYVPSLEQVGVIFEAVHEHWSVARNPLARFRNAAARTFFSRRDRAILAVQASVGLRPGETFALTLTDYNIEERTLHVRHSKTYRSRYVPVTDRLAGFLDEWLAARPTASPSDYLFVTDCGGPLHLDSWGHQFQRYLSFARGQGHDLPRITLYSLRHVAGTSLALGAGVYKASLLLGHQSSRTTEEHYVRAKVEAIRQDHADHDPLAGIFRKASRGTRAPRLV